VRRPAVVNSRVPQRLPRGRQSPTRPEVMRYKPRCTDQKRRMNQRGGSRGARSCLSDMTHSSPLRLGIALVVFMVHRDDLAAYYGFTGRSGVGALGVAPGATRPQRQPGGHRAIPAGTVDQGDSRPLPRPRRPGRTRGASRGICGVGGAAGVAGVDFGSSRSTSNTSRSMVLRWQNGTGDSRCGNWWPLHS